MVWRATNEHGAGVRERSNDRRLRAGNMLEVGQRLARRRLLRGLALVAIGLLGSCGPSPSGDGAARQLRVLVLGMDGMDPILVADYIGRGLMPAFARLADRGAFLPLRTSNPPQSPVAWSNFISGAYPDTHAIWDFIHRQPVPPAGSAFPVVPYLSMFELVPAPRPLYTRWLPDSIPFGARRLDLSAGERAVSLRRGPAFWEALVAAGVDTTIYRLPANYPPPENVSGPGRFRCLCGMGTPDLLGTYGWFTCFKSNIGESWRVSGGRFVRVALDAQGHGSGRLIGPADRCRSADKGARQETAIDVDFQVDRVARAVQVEIGATRLRLREHEWSDWIPIAFPTCLPAWLPGGNAPAMVRLHVRAVEPDLHVYFSPPNIDPMAAALAISAPPEFAAAIAAASGRYATVGIPEDTKALRAEPQALDEDEFLELVQHLAAERSRQFAEALEEFRGQDSGFLFYYFGHTDQLAHVFWRDIDPGHPGRRPGDGAKYARVIENAYVDMDRELARALDALGEDDAIVVMSDHGFGSFRRGFDVNTWLRDHGYQAWHGVGPVDRAGELRNLRFDATRAYGLGINGLYVNLRGRERDGIVPPDQYDALLHEIGEKLLAVRDAEHGDARVVERVDYVKETYPDADMLVAPDLLIGYARNYRGSWAAVSGGMSGRVLEDNLSRWSGDHCTAHDLVPGILVTNLGVDVEDPELSDLAPSILGLYGLAPPAGMVGRRILSRPDAPHP
jgi:predicted AlkP superfamily phosphohydrolase/phosphomutase